MKNIIGICGPSGTGKSTIANYLAGMFNTSVVNFDTYVKDKTKVPESFGFKNYEVPQAYKVGTCSLDLGKNTPAHGIQFVEGFLLYASSVLRNAITHKIYIYLPTNVVIQRRRTRWIIEDRTVDEVYLAKVLGPFSEQYMHEQLPYADLVIDGRKDMFTITAEITQYLEKRGVRPA